MVLMLLTRIAENPFADVLTGVCRGVLRRERKSSPAQALVGGMVGGRKQHFMACNRYLKEYN